MTLGIQVQLMPMRLLVMLKIRMVKLVLLVEMPLEEIQVQLVRLLLLSMRLGLLLQLLFGMRLVLMKLLGLLVIVQL